MNRKEKKNETAAGRMRTRRRYVLDTATAIAAVTPAVLLTGP